MMLQPQISGYQGTTPRGPSMGTTGRAVQRKCACGGSSSASAECETCGRKTQNELQRYSTDRESLTGLACRAGAAGAMPPQDSQTGSGIVGGGHNFGMVRIHREATSRVQMESDSVSEIVGKRKDRKLPARATSAEPGDRYEQEADNVAEWSTRLHRPSAEEPLPQAPALGSAPSIIQRAPMSHTDSGNSPDESGVGTGARTTSDRDPAPAGFIVEDDALQSAPEQMRKTEFLNRLEKAVCASADQELARVGRTAQGCPYITTWIGYYRTRSAKHIERALFRYAPEAAGARSAGDYIPLVAERIRRAVTVWATTGQITGVPDELAGQIGGGGLLAGVGAVLSGIGGAVAGAIGSIGKSIGGLFRKAKDSGPTQDADPERVQAQLGPGQGLEASVKSRMERAMGHDFSRVRVHTDSSAAVLSSDLNARAFTVGSDIAFATGEYHPGTLIGDALLAHELAHVVQQAGGNGSSAPMQKGDSPQDSLEEDADLAAISAVTSIWGDARGALSGLSQRTTPHLRSGLGLQRCHHAAPAAPTKSQTTPESKEQPELPDAPPPPNCPSHTWADYRGGIPRGDFPAGTHFHLVLGQDQGRQIVKAIFDPGLSPVRPKYSRPTDPNASGCGDHIAACARNHRAQIARGNRVSTYAIRFRDLQCDPAIIPNPSPVDINSVQECTSVVGKACTDAAVPESQRLLKHEQLHFTIACIVAKKATDAIAAHPDQAQAILQAAQQKANDLSSDTGPYDSETEHGCNSSKQADWEKDVRKGLPSVTVP